VRPGPSYNFPIFSANDLCMVAVLKNKKNIYFEQRDRTSLCRSTAMYSIPILMV
jgi:hypothetical protein